MSSINSLDLKTLITKSVSDVFDTMLSMQVETIDDTTSEISNGHNIVGTVGFAGTVPDGIFRQGSSESIVQ